MYLEKIKITNFRCFDSAGIEACFNKGVNSVIGENNAGKSALIDALRIAFSAVPYQRDIYFKKSDFHPAEPAPHPTNGISALICAASRRECLYCNTLRVVPGICVSRDSAPLLSHPFCNALQVLPRIC